MKKRLVCFLLAAIMCISLMPALGAEASAASCEQQAIVDAAISHEGQTAKNFPDVCFDWCVYFVTYCANEVGLSSPASAPRAKLFPPITKWKENDWAATGVEYQINWFTKYSHGKLYYFKDSRAVDKNQNTVKANANTFEPIPGDLVYIHHPDSSNTYNHVAIVYKYDAENQVVYYIGGNQSNSDWRYSDVSYREISLDENRPLPVKDSTDKNKKPDQIAGFLRPNYSTEYVAPNSPDGYASNAVAGCTYGKNCPSKSFEDVPASAWYHQSVDYCVSNDLFKGTGDTSFSPDSTMTRAMMVTVLYRLDGSPDVAAIKNPFKDVNSKMWSYDAVKWAYDTGVTEGYSNTKFAPDEKITRAQAAKMLYSYAQYLKLDCSKKESYSKYEDAKQVPEWAAPAMKWSIGNGIIQGISDTKLDPNGNATRAQLAAVLERYAKHYDIFNLVKPTATPEPTATVKPTATPKPTTTVKPTATPKPTTTVKPTATPTPTTTVKPTATPTPTVKPTATPTPTTTVKTTATPTPAPTGTPIPVASTMPAA